MIKDLVIDIDKGSKNKVNNNREMTSLIVSGYEQYKKGVLFGYSKNKDFDFEVNFIVDKKHGEIGGVEIHHHPDFIEDIENNEGSSMFIVNKYIRDRINRDKEFYLEYCVQLDNE